MGPFHIDKKFKQCTTVSDLVPIWVAVLVCVKKRKKVKKGPRGWVV